MGLRLPVIGEMLEYLGEKKALNKIELLELGDQIFRGWKSARASHGKGRGGRQYRLMTGKQFFSGIGFNHTSVDINGKRGSIRCDLTRLLPVGFMGKYDIITNSGTSEHIPDQYMTFKNIHFCAKSDCIVMHALPNPLKWKNHGIYYYDKSFMPKLCDLCGYVLLKHIKCHDNLVFSAYRINGNKDFISKDIFNTLPYGKNAFDASSKWN